MRILLRGDSGFCREALMAWCEANRVDYVFGLARNPRLTAEIETEMAAAQAVAEPRGETRDACVVARVNEERYLGRRLAESAGVTLVKGDLRGIVRARRLSRATLRNIRQNLFFAFVYNSLGVPIAAGVLYPFLGVLLSPMVAAAAMSLSSVSVIANALRLRRVRL